MYVACWNMQITFENYFGRKDYSQNDFEVDEFQTEDSKHV